MSIRIPRFSASAALAIGGGVLVALSLPPWGIWPLAFLGVACSRCRSARIRRDAPCRAGWLFGAAWMYPGMAWMWSLTPPGYILAAAIYAGYHAWRRSCRRPGPWRVIGRPAAHTLAEALRMVFPFGGVPLATLPIGQAGGPFAGTVRVGVGTAVDVVRVPDRLRARRPVTVRAADGASAGAKRGRVARCDRAGTAILVWVVAAAIAPSGTDAAQPPSLRVTYVQGGGPQGNTGDRFRPS
jgi:apolipoprotein N-acyltransferase